MQNMPSEKSVSRFSAFLSRRAQTVAVTAALCCLVGQFGSLHWLAELFSHFTLFAVAAWLLAALLVRGRARWLWLGLAAVSAAYLLLPWPFAPFRLPENGAGRSVVWYNVNLDNPAAADESRALLADGADVLALGEIDLDDAGWRPLRSVYPHGCAHREDSPFALALWSRRPLSGCTVGFVDTTAGSFAFIRAQLGDTALYALHPPPPVSVEMAVARNRYLDELSVKIASENRVLVVGDLNSTPFSPLFRRFTERAGLTSATPKFLPTWRPFGLPIDHALGRNVSVRAVALPWRHSDHRPLRTDWF